MWSSRLFWKLFSSYAALNLAATITFVVIVSGWQEEQVVEQIKQRLRDSATLVRSHVEELLMQGRTKQLQAQIRKLGEEIDTRITLVTMAGEVLSDSKQSSLAAVVKMENHKDRLELVQAASHGHGTSERESPTLGEPMLYVALRADGESGPSGLVRTAMSMSQVREQVTAIRRLIWAVALLVSLAVVGLSYFVAARVVHPVTQLISAAEAIAEGTYQPKLYMQANDELGTLAKSFNRMNDQLDARLAELRESSQRLTTVLEGMVEGVIALDERERIVLANGAAGRQLGFSPAEAEGRPLIEAVRIHSLNQALTDALPGQSYRTEIELGGDEDRVLAVHVSPLFRQSATNRILVLQDVTELRRLDTMRQEFVANVSHELKTPLSSIKAYAETLSRGAIHDQQNNLLFVQRIEEQADRLHELILDLLSLSRIESGKQAFDIVPVCVADIVQSCLSEHQAAASARGIRLTTTCESSDLKVSADPEGLREILDNLIDNAMKHTSSEGQVSVNWQDENSLAVLEVRDTGIGIAAEHLPRVFERFYRVDKARSRELGGTGLGLAIVKHLAQSFGGTVEVKSDIGKGSVFIVSLPIAG